MFNSTDRPRAYAIERRADHDIEYNAEAPRVISSAVVRDALQYLRRGVRCTAAVRAAELVSRLDTREAKVGQFDVVVHIEQNVLALEISVHTHTHTHTTPWTESSLSTNLTDDTLADEQTFQYGMNNVRPQVLQVNGGIDEDVEVEPALAVACDRRSMAEVELHCF